MFLMSITGDILWLLFFLPLLQYLSVGFHFFADYFSHFFTNMFFLCSFHILHINRLTILYSYMCAVNPRKMFFKYFIRIVYGNRNYRTFCFVCKFEAGFMKFKQFLALISCSFQIGRASCRERV